MRELNLVIAGLYTLWFISLMVSSIASNNMLALTGLMAFTPPIIVNWVTFFNLKKLDKDK